MPSFFYTERWRNFYSGRKKIFFPKGKIFLTIPSWSIFIILAKKSLDEIKYKTKGIWNGFLARKIRQPSQFLDSGKTNELAAGQEGHRATSRKWFLLFFLWKLGSGAPVYLLTTLFLFLVTIESGLVECFLCQPPAKPIFIILEISMSHKINLNPALPSMGTSFLELFKRKRKKMMNLESNTAFIRPHAYFLLHQGSFSETWKPLKVCSLVPDPFLSPSPDPSPEGQAGAGKQRKPERSEARKWLTGSWGGKEGFPQEWET